MNHYEVNFIIDPVLSGDEIKSTAKVYETLLVDNGCSIVHVNEMGLRQLAYSINKRTSGIFYCIEFTSPGGAIISKLELALRRDERIIRFLTVKLDKYGVKYNEDRRSGKITSYKKKEKRKADGEVVVAEKPEPVAIKTPAPASIPVAAPVINEEE
jgi:small subunit ribosomal protein S6